jgi:hypothetical protein
MSSVVYTPGVGLLLGAESGIGSLASNLISTSPTANSTQARVLAPPRWTLKLVQPETLTRTEAGRWVAMLAGLQGRANLLYMWDPMRPGPLGTMSGTSYTLNEAVSAGATSISLAGGTSGQTLLAGDWIQVQRTGGVGVSELVRVTDLTATADSSGVITVNVAPSLRIDHSAGVTCSTYYARSYFRANSAAYSMAGGGNLGSLITGMSLDLTEELV